MLFNAHLRCTNWNGNERGFFFPHASRSSTIIWIIHVLLSMRRPFFPLRFYCSVMECFFCCCWCIFGCRFPVFNFMIFNISPASFECPRLSGYICVSFYLAIIFFAFRHFQFYSFGPLIIAFLRIWLLADRQPPVLSLDLFFLCVWYEMRCSPASSDKAAPQQRQWRTISVRFCIQRSFQCTKKFTEFNVDCYCSVRFEQRYYRRAFCGWRYVFIATFSFHQPKKTNKRIIMKTAKENRNANAWNGRNKSVKSANTATAFHLNWRKNRFFSSVPCTVCSRCRCFSSALLHRFATPKRFCAVWFFHTLPTSTVDQRWK